jgi:uncharacterized membrane protein YphA (DoxX/SURF4 family)
MLMNLLKQSLAADSASDVQAWGHLILRASADLMIFYIHGWHKLEGWIAYLQNGTPWKLAKEVAEMHVPAPLASAVAATLVQFICAPFIAAGLCTRINAVLLVGALSGAILAGRKMVQSERAAVTRPQCGVASPGKTIHEIETSQNQERPFRKGAPQGD